MAAQRRGLKLDRCLFQKSKTGLYPALNTEFWERCLIWNTHRCKVALLKFFLISVSNFKVKLLLTYPQGFREAPSVTLVNWSGLFLRFGVQMVWVVDSGSPELPARHSLGAWKQEGDGWIIPVAVPQVCRSSSRKSSVRFRDREPGEGQHRDSPWSVLVTARHLYPTLLPDGQFSIIQLSHRII